MSTLTPENRAEVWTMFAEMRAELGTLERRVAAVELVAVTVSHAAHMTSLRQSDLREAISRGELPSLRVGRRVVIMTPDLRAWLDGLKKTQAMEVAR